MYLFRSSSYVRSAIVIQKKHRHHPLDSAISRYREFAADRGSAQMTGKPVKLANALLKISGTMKRIPTKDLRQVEGLNAFFIVPALSGSTIGNLFSTHPPVGKRVQKIMEMEASMS